MGCPREKRRQYHVTDQKILAPTDFSECSFRGVSEANELALHFSSELLMIHVVSSTPIIPSGIPPVPASGEHLADMMDDLMNTARLSMNHTIDEKISKDISSRSFVLSGIPADEIVRVAEDEKVDLIVIATHGLTGWKKFIFGSITEKVLKMAECPVLTIPCADE